MRSDNQPGRGSGASTDGTDYTSTDYGGADFGSPLPGGPGSGGRRPWFGPKRIGWGIRPQTWQGWAVTALMTAVIIAGAAVGKGKPWFFIVVIAVIAVPFVIIAIQRPRR